LRSRERGVAADRAGRPGVAMNGRPAGTTRTTRRAAAARCTSGGSSP